MPSPNEKLAASLTILQDRQGTDRHVFRSEEFERAHRERLKRNGFLRSIIKGWFMLGDPGASPNDTTPWYASFWEFCARYGAHRFGDRWHLAPAQSLLLHAENTAVPNQVLIHAVQGANNRIQLPFGTSFFDLKTAQMPPAEDLCEKNGVRVFTPEAALVRAPSTFFRDCPIEAQTVLAGIEQTSGLLRRLLAGSNSVIAGRLAGAFRHIGREDTANEIVRVMRETEHRLRESNPFVSEDGDGGIRKAFPGAPKAPAIAQRLRALWEVAREPVLASFPNPPGLPSDEDFQRRYLEHMQDVYVQDAYHSLSIEGYRVTPELIQRVSSGSWNPEAVESDRRDRNALAARGYWQAFQAVQETTRRILQGARAGVQFKSDHALWYLQLFQPFVAAGVFEPASLAGYRNQTVFLRGSRHVPPRWEIIPGAMTALFELLEEEPEPAVRAAAGHWLFGYIHPYPDGNGRMARFLLNGMLASGGYSWTIVRVEQRQAYMAALEAASVNQHIQAYADFMASVVQEGMEAHPLPAPAPGNNPPAPIMAMTP